VIAVLLKIAALLKAAAPLRTRMYRCILPKTRIPNGILSMAWVLI